ncbi:response regulator transcription factor [Allorhizobium taibaishanense]|uniref:DNA-binding response regulator n=1 Tax=Allorhizobium taibaishanense TaxID=887144 RepID=A0A1Q9A6T7_9HYPH|nr:response regulator transcription factor [Allorhizobium taibaishanense]MBB4008540.1 FixJ family two-component response regulator [Allorhizobium taibaishanense]OLP50306.1 DNA-binding response regulator [Allorhizobium taibaishanense]
MTDGLVTETAGEPIVYVVDDDLSVRVALEDLLASVGLQVRSHGSVQDFLATPLVDAPGCLVLDVRMPGQSGLEFQQQMERLGLKLPVIFITGHGDIAMSVKAMKNGAIEFLTKPFRDQDLLDAIQQGIALDSQNRRQAQSSADLMALWQKLTPGECEVMELVVQGLLNKQIAGAIGVSEITVKVRRAHLMRKLNARSVADLVRIWDQVKPQE